MSKRIGRCLGKRAAKFNSNIKRVDLILNRRKIIVPPASKIWMPATTNWPMWGNDAIGDCTAVSVASAILTMTSVAQAPIELTLEQVVKIYSLTTGYNPADPSTDQGGIEDDVLGFWTRTGVPQHGIGVLDSLSGYGSVAPTNVTGVKQVIYLCGGLYIGLQLPNYAVEQDGDWTIQSANSDIAGGHAVFIHGYDENWLYLNTWATTKRMSWDFFFKYCDEAHALISRLDWTGADQDTTPVKQSIEALREAVLG